MIAVCNNVITQTSLQLSLAPIYENGWIEDTNQHKLEVNGEQEKVSRL